MQIVALIVSLYLFFGLSTLFCMAESRIIADNYKLFDATKLLFYDKGDLTIKRVLALLLIPGTESMFYVVIVMCQVIGRIISYIGNIKIYKRK